jgi:hypothetical protein
MEADKMNETKNTSQQRNEGEGNRTAAREYNEAQQRFVKSGQVADRARDAAEALDKDSIRRELEHAEEIGRRHSAGEDPAIRRTGKTDKKD